MANVASIIANRGHYYDPKIVIEINNEKLNNSEINVLDINKEHFNYVVNAMEEVVISGSGRRGYLKELKLWLGMQRFLN